MSQYFSSSSVKILNDTVYHLVFNVSLVIFIICAKDITKFDMIIDNHPGCYESEPCSRKSTYRDYETLERA